MEEMKNEIMKQGAVQEESYKSGSVHYIDSREVAKMVEKEHSNLLKDIRRYITQMGKVKIDFSEFFIESLYRVEGQSREYPCYLVTEKGCEFIAHKMTSEKGTAFTVAYIDRFHEMKGALEGQQDSALREFLIQQSKFNQMVMERFEKMENRSVGISSQNPFSVQQDVIDQRMRALNVWSFPVPIILSLAINQLRFKRFKRSVQTILYASSFFSNSSNKTSGS